MKNVDVANSRGSGGNCISTRGRTRKEGQLVEVAHTPVMEVDEVEITAAHQSPLTAWQDTKPKNCGCTKPVLTAQRRTLEIVFLQQHSQLYSNYVKDTTLK